MMTQPSLLSPLSDIQYGNTHLSLYIAVEYGHVDQIKQALDKNIDINAQNTDGKLALQLAIDEKNNNNKNNLSKYQNIISIFTTYKKSDNETLLHTAAKHGYVTLAQLLVNNGADINAKDNYHNTPLHYTVKYSQDELLVISTGDQRSLFYLLKEYPPSATITSIQR